MCVVASPTLTHADVGLRLADAGVHALIEKPLTSDPQSGRLLAKAFEERGLIGAVGHIERYNPAVSALQARLAQGDLGSVFQITTRRQGPFPQRIRDVGVVMDLATHDIDLTQWVTGCRYLTVTAFTAHPSGRTHEDLVTVNGRARRRHRHQPSGELAVFDERTGHHGDRRARLPDRQYALDRAVVLPQRLGHDFAHRGPRFHGASEGDQIRYAISKREALSAELEAFRDAILGKPADIVTLRQGVDTLKVADAILAASRNCTAVTLDTGEPSVPNQRGDPARGHPAGGEMTGEVTVVGLGKIGLPLAVQIAGKGFRVHGADRNPEVIRLVAQGSPPFPGEPGLAERLRAVVEAGMLIRHIRHGTGRGAKRCGHHRRAAGHRRGGQTGLLGGGRGHRRRGGRAASWHPGQLRDHAAGTHHAATARAGPGRGIRPEPGQRFHAVPQPGAGIQRDGLCGPAPVPEARRRDRRAQRQECGGVLQFRPGLR